MGEGTGAAGHAVRSAEAGRAVEASWDDGGTATYDAWADGYERDLFAAGYRLPAMLAATIARHVEPGEGTVLDAGCGTGAVAEPLAMLGYRLVGIDLSPRMLACAREKGIYEALHEVAVDARIGVSGGPFAAAMAGGVLTPGHAPPEGMDGLIGAVRPGGIVAIMLRDDEAMDPAYAARMAALEASGRWARLMRSEPFAGMPYGQPEIMHRVHVLRVA